MVEDVTGHVPMEEEKVPSPVEPQQPLFLETPQDFRLVEGTNAIFECRVSGRPFPEITWTRSGFPVRNDARYALVQQMSIPVFIGLVRFLCIWNVEIIICENMILQ